jgi:hypothetical protein
LAAGSCSAGRRRGITALRVGWFTAVHVKTAESQKDTANSSMPAC